jgi:integrase
MHPSQSFQGQFSGSNLMATIEAVKSKKKGVRHRVHIRVAGYPRRSATFTSVKEARAWAARVEADMRSGKYQDDGFAAVYSAAEMIDRYLQHVLPVKSQKKRYLEGQKQQLSWWRQRIGAHRLNTLNQVILSECRDELHIGGKRGKRTGATVNRYIAAINHVFTTAEKEWGWIRSNPMKSVRKLPESRGRVRFLSPEERDKLLKVSAQFHTKPLYDVVLLALSTGARKGELLGIRLADIDLTRHCITIHDTKNGESRRLALSGEALQMVQRRCGNSHNATYLFEHPRTRNPYQIDDVWHKARCAAGIPDFHFHDLRHTFASYMAMSGASLAEIAEALGHKKLEMVKRYAHLSESHTSAVIAGMVERFLTVSEKTGAQTSPPPIS